MSQPLQIANSSTKTFVTDLSDVLNNMKNTSGNGILLLQEESPCQFSLEELAIHVGIDTSHLSIFNVHGTIGFYKSLWSEDCYVTCSILKRRNEHFAKVTRSFSIKQDILSRQRCFFTLDNFISEAWLKENKRDIFTDSTNGTLCVICEIKLMKKDFKPIMTAIDDNVAILLSNVTGSSWTTICARASSSSPTMVRRS